MEYGMKMIFLHHSTGEIIWNAGVRWWFDGYNSDNGTKHTIECRAYPERSSYGWKNYPYDYWNLWVKHGGRRRLGGEKTLRYFAKRYDVIIFKHCFPVSAIEADTGAPDIESEAKRVENYRLQYLALREKMREHGDTLFVLWTGAALTEGATTQKQARRAREFFDWVRGSWDEPGDNIFLWDFYELETEGGLFMKNEHARGPCDPHPGVEFAGKVAPMLCRRIVDV